MVALDGHHRQGVEEALDVRLQEGGLVGMVEAAHRRLGEVERPVAGCMDPLPGRCLDVRVGSPGLGAQHLALAPVRRVRGALGRNALGRTGQAVGDSEGGDAPAHLAVHRHPGRALRLVRHGGHRGHVGGRRDGPDGCPQPERPQVALGNVPIVSSAVVTKPRAASTRRSAGA